MATNRSTRKLAVILHADVIGSTALVQRDETVAHERIRDAFRRFSETIRAYGGTPQELRGDALLATFDRASDAVSASLSFQTENAHHNAALEDDIRPDVRIGIALGEVVIADGTLTGPDVVMAQRIEQLAEPGGICIQSTAYETIPRRLHFEYTSLGEQAVKGFNEPIRVFVVKRKVGEEIPRPDSQSSGKTSSVRRSLSLAVVALIVIALGSFALLGAWRSEFGRSDSAETEFKLPKTPSIAVFPFENRDGNTEQNYFSDGITEDLITDLAKVSGLLVVSPQVVFQLKGQKFDPRVIRQKLRVTHVLNGSVRRSEELVRITAQLTETANGLQVWAERFDRKVEDVFAVQDEIVGEIFAALELKLTEGERQLVQSRPEINARAYDYLLRARASYTEWTPQSNREAIRLANRALEIDPNFTEAHVRLAHAWFQAWIIGGSADLRQLDAGMVAAKNAVESAPHSPVAHSTLGWIHLWRKEHDDAIASMERALEIDPNYAEGRARLSEALMFAGRPADALDQLNRARRRTTVEFYAYGFWAGEALYS